MVAPRLMLPGTRPQGALWLALGAALTFGGQQLWQRWHAGELGDPVTTSLIAFERHDRLTVFSAQLSPVVSADEPQMFGMIRAHQVAVIPARVDYGLDLSRMRRGNFRWDEASHRLNVELPPLSLSRPNLDEGRAQYLREGVWIGREAQAKLTRNNTLLAEKQASEAAAGPVLMGLAREAAKQAMRQNIELPLRAAGYRDITVTVHFAGESATD